MVKIVKVLLFLAICLTAAWVGSDLALSQLTKPYFKCETWTCTGTIQFCTFGPNQHIDACFENPAETCYLTGQYEACHGEYPTGAACYVNFVKCVP